jgi:hypothetical protein
MPNIEQERRDLENRPFQHSDSPEAGELSQERSAADDILPAAGVLPATRSDPAEKSLFTRSKVVEILIGIAVSLLTFIGYRMSTLDESVKNMNTRIDRVFEAFPEFRRRIAEERSTQTLRLALLVLRSRSNRDEALVHLIDVDRRSRKTFIIPVRLVSNRFYMHHLHGFANSIDPYALSLAQYQAELEGADLHPLKLPGYLYADASFAMTTRPSSSALVDDIRALIMSFGRPLIEQNFELAGSTFEDLANDVTTRPERWTVVPTQSPHPNTTTVK